MGEGRLQSCIEPGYYSMGSRKMPFHIWTTVEGTKTVSEVRSEYGGW